jgi:hypothetical protein
MKRLLFYIGLPICMLATVACKKSEEAAAPAEPKRWLKVYKDVVIANDKYVDQGQFLNTSTGMTVMLADATDDVRKQLALTCFIPDNGNYVYLSAPGSMSGSVENRDRSRALFTATPNGINNWKPVQQNTSLLRPVAGGMTASAFDNLAGAGSWKAFNDAFKANNAGKPDLAFVKEYEFADNGDIFLVEINGALRMIFKTTAVSNDPTKGYIRADVIVEGREDMAAAGKPLMPAQ